MNLQIISAQRTESHAIAWLEFTTPVGNFVIQPGHAPMVATLQPASQLIFCLTNGKEETITISNAIAEITRTGATILLSTSI